MEKAIIEVLMLVLSVMQNPQVPAQQKLEVFNKVMPIVQQMNRQLQSSSENTSLQQVTTDSTTASTTKEIELAPTKLNNLTEQQYQDYQRAYRSVGPGSQIRPAVSP